MSDYEALGFNYFNPQVDNWTPECAEIEADHLAEDQIILFPITGETHGMGSLAETGFSILNAIKLDDRRDFVLYIENDLVDDLKPAEDEKDTPKAALYKESLRARRLVLAHMKKLRLGNVYIAESLDQMKEISKVLYSAAQTKETIANRSMTALCS